MAVAMAMPVPIPATTIHDPTNRPLEPTLVRALRNSPAASKMKPAATATLAPTTWTTRAAGTAPMMSPATRGKRRTPEPMAVVASTPWKYWGMVKRIPSMASTGTTAKTTPQVNEAEANKLRSTNGWPPGWWVKRRSQAKNPTNNTRPTNIKARAPTLPHPSWPALISP